MARVATATIAKAGRFQSPRKASRKAYSILFLAAIGRLNRLER
jgi:hypothetical protein